jgi:4,5-DOPA dioxygenase extradiol
MNAVSTNRYTEAWSRLGQQMPRPRAILAVSAHWYVPTTAVTMNARPKTIHDFGGFPRQLYDVQYPAPGDPQLARRVQELLAPRAVQLDDAWGLDHGTWSVLCHVYPNADVPVVQLSIDETQPAEFHYKIGKQLAALREEGILIVGSGNRVHNLHASAWGNPTAEPYDWALRFESSARRLMLDGNDLPLVDYQNLGDDALLAAPTPDHYLPLLYVLGARRAADKVSFPVDGVDGGSVSMLSVQLG